MKWRILFIMAIIVLGLQFSTASKAMRARVSIGNELVYQNGVPGVDLSLYLLDFDVSEYKQNYTIFLYLWNNSQCTSPLRTNTQINELNPKPYKITIDALYGLQQSYRVFVPFKDLSENTRSVYGANYYSPVTIYWSLDLCSTNVYKPVHHFAPHFDNNQNGFTCRTSYRLFNVQLKSQENINLYNDAADQYPEVKRLAQKYSEEDIDQGTCGEILKVNYLPNVSLIDKYDNFQVRFRFYHGTGRQHPCNFYESLEKVDAKRNAKTFYFKPDGYEERTNVVNFIRRNRHDWNSFYVLIPDFVYNFADFDYEKSKRGENDSIYVYADIYDMNDNLVCEGSYYVYWVRTPVKKDTTCYHTDCEITENVISRTPLSEDYVLIKYDRIRVCKNCGKKFVEKNLEKTEFCKTPPSGKHEHVWEYLEPKTIFSSLQKMVSNNGCWILESCDYINKRKCLICELVEDLPNTSDINISSNMEAPANKECCPEGRYIEEVVDKAPVKVGSRTKIEKKITTYFDCPNRERQVIGERSEVEWLDAPVCSPHDFRLVETEELDKTPNGRIYHVAEIVFHYRCQKCGLTKDEIKSKQCKHEYEKPYKLCLPAKPWVVTLGGRQIKMHLSIDPADSTAVYVAETETTQGMWTAVCPDNNKGWNDRSTYPVSNVTYEEVMAFISKLNTMAAEQGCPMKFRLPTTQEWEIAYRNGGVNKESWLGFSGSVVHPVAELPANDLHLYDMKGNVSELCSDSVLVGNEDDKVLMRAVAGSNYEDYPSSMSPMYYRWMDLSEGTANVGFRLFADPVYGDEKQMEPETTVTYTGTANILAGQWWTVRNVFRCKDCGYLSYGLLRHIRAHATNQPRICK